MSQFETTNGAGAAAILSAAVGCFLVGFIFLLSDSMPAVNSFLQFYPPSGDLSGNTTIAVGVWLVLWYYLSHVWKDTNVNMWKVNFFAFLLLIASFLLTFPPFIDFLQGK